MKLALII